MRKLALFLLAGLAGGMAVAADDFLHPDVAFKVRAIATAPDRVEVIFQVAPGYYLYRHKMNFTVGPDQPVALGTPDLPKGKIKIDKYLSEEEQELEVYLEDVAAKLPVSRGSKEAFVLNLKVGYQGCAEAGLCYSPTTKTFDVELPAATSVAELPKGGGSSVGGGYVSEQDRLASLISEGNIFLMAGAFFLAGLLLAFTPCVL